MDHAGDPGADPFGRFDITARANVVEFHDAAPISAIVTLDASLGKFLTATPVIKRWDRIYLEGIDQFGNICFQQVVTVKKRKRMRSTGKGLQLKLICPHESYNLMKHPIMLPDRRSSGYQTLNDAIAQITDSGNLGANDPTIVITSPLDLTNKRGNFLNTATNNDYIFEGDMFQDVVDKIMTVEGNVVSAGGAFQFDNFRFVSLYKYSDNSNLGVVAIQAIPQGYKNNGGVMTNVPTVTVQKSPIGSPPSNYISTDNDDDTEEGTNIIAIGDRNSGTYKTDTSIYQGQLDAFNAAAPWNSATPYIVGQRVNYNGSFYHCNVNLPSGPNAPPTIDVGHWSAAETFTPTVQYSPLTKQKAQYWINACGGWIHAGTMGAEVSVVDPNIIIQDNLHNRTWADGFGNNPAVIDSRMLLPVTFQPFDGLRMLCVGTGVGAWAGNDPNGVPFANNLLEYRGTAGSGGAWYVYRVTQQDDEIFVFRENISYVFNPANTNSFVDGTGQVWLQAFPFVVHGGRQSGWIQGAYQAINLPGIGVIAAFTPGAQFECVHPVKHDVSANVEIGNEKISPTDIDGNSAVYANFAPTQGPRNFFAGLNFAFPWPRNSNEIPYGPVTLGEQILLFVFDLLNMSKTHNGKVETFGQGVEDYFPIQGFSFFELLQDLLPLGIFDPAGDYTMGIWLADRKDNVVLITYDHGHNNVTEPASPALGTLKVYRGIPGISTFLPAQQIEILNIFDVRSVIRGGIYTVDSFDTAGRYFMGTQQVLSPIAWSNASRFHVTEKIHFSIDAFRMVKPLVSTNIRGSKPVRNITPQFKKYTTVVSKYQLDNIVNSLQAIQNFQPQNFTLQTQGRGDVRWLDPVYYTDTEIIPDTTDGFPNTLKTVANEIIYTISKPSQGPGGLVRTLNLITRVWPN